ncbi:COMM domain-containing protein 4 isoform X1 [Bombyx mandarina]|uniref:COMM domain-containing protein 4 isoform X1 n=1 Tax=Bombyx mandarina TaxID=7092 RepID=A0A6J2KG86_BOMMA|nr:COMM domain-containing protein 4 isoform X1 [Bombyx mandarina]
MKFKFCSDGDCPLWALAALHALSSLPASIFRELVRKVQEDNSDDSIMEVLKDTNYSSRDECARAAAVIRWVLKQAWSCSCGGAQLTRDLLVLGVPRAHATALADVVDEGAQDYKENVKNNGFMVNKVTDISIAKGPKGSVDTYKLTIHTDNVFIAEQNRKELLIDETQAKVMLEELKKAYKKMEEIGNETGNKS